MSIKRFPCRFLLTVSLVVFVSAPVILAQDGVGYPDAFSPVTVDPIKSTAINNGTKMVRQFESVPADLKVLPITSDYEVEFFKYEQGWKPAEGSSQKIRAAYNYTSGNGKNEVSAGFTENIMSVNLFNKIAFNHIFSIKGRRHFFQNEDFSISSGLGTDWVIFSNEIVKDAMTPDFKEMNRSGVNIGLDFVAKKRISTQNIVAGVLFQESFANKSSMLDMGLAALWGMPILKRFSINADILYRRTIMGMVKNYVYEEAGLVDNGYKKVDYSESVLGTPHSLNLGLGGTFLLSKSFGLNAGYRTQLLIKNYLSNTIFVGGRFAF
ncbi:MAG: hypothetical protein GX556_05120 [Fibrobacter sp.]|nr:hypothetical protein [Fibrobacter sp.]